MDETLTMKWGMNSQGILREYKRVILFVMSEPTLTSEYIVSVHL